MCPGVTLLFTYKPYPQRKRLFQAFQLLKRRCVPRAEENCFSVTDYNCFRVCVCFLIHPFAECHLYQI